MQKLTNTQYKRKQELEAALHSVTTQIQAEVTAVNDHLETAKDRLENLVERYNGLVDEATTYIESVHQAQESYMESRSDAWTDSDKGERYLDWADAWTAELDHVDAEVPETMDEPDLTALDTLQELPLVP